jgi:hypothetical protein
VIIIYFIYSYYTSTEKYKNITKIKLDKIQIIKRTPEYQKLIDKLINKKKNSFTKEELDVMKNKFQFYNTEYGIDNISDEILATFKDYENNNDNNNDNNNNNIYIEETINENPVYNSILNTIGDKYKSSCKDVEVLKNPEYLKNYYYDMNANKIKSNLKDYINDYQIQIDENNNISQKVEIEKPSFKNTIIPDQYPTQKYLTNAYLIDWSRLQNPLTVY